MQENGQRRFAHWMGLFLMACTALATSGCASMYHVAHYNWLTTFEQTVSDHHRSYFHSGRTGRIIAKTHRHASPVEPDCFGYEPTCWYNWPAHCVSACPPPEQIIEEEVIEPQRTQEPMPEEAQDGSGLEGILDLDAPLPGETPIVPDRSGASVPPTPTRKVAPRPPARLRHRPSVTQNPSLDEAEEFAAYKASIARRWANQRPQSGQSLGGAEVPDVTPVADVSLPSDMRPAPAAIAPSIVQSVSGRTAPSLMQVSSTPNSGISSRRTTVPTAATTKSQAQVADDPAQLADDPPQPPAEPEQVGLEPTAKSTSELRVQPPATQALENRTAMVFPELTLDPQEFTVPTVELELPATLNEGPVQTPEFEPETTVEPSLPERSARIAPPARMTVESSVPSTKSELPEANREPVQSVQNKAALPSFKIIAVGPDSDQKQTKPAGSIRFASGKATGNDDDSQLKFR